MDYSFRLGFEKTGSRGMNALAAGIGNAALPLIGGPALSHIVAEGDSKEKARVAGGTLKGSLIGTAGGAALGGGLGALAGHGFHGASLGGGLGYLGGSAYGAYKGSRPNKKKK